MSLPADWQKVRELFHGALEHPAADRMAFVRQRCPDDEAVRQEVESLLAAHPQADGFLSSPARGLDPGPREAPRLAPGTRLGPFTIAALIGSGGMGEVYRALDTRLDRPVAIKVLAPAFAADPRGRDRFEREARLISKLTHPHICTLYDVGSALVGGADVRYLVMELVDGETLAARLQRGPLPLDDAVAVAIQIAGALAAAHAAGVIHRDLKPANIMLTRSGVKLLDFGLARLGQRDDEELDAASADPLTGAGAIIGTLPYMSPEQLRGGEADARSELFAFGAVLYEMLTGARAFTADSQPALVAAILETEPPRLSVRQPGAPASLDRLVSTCLAKDPDDRWQSARDLLRELTWIRDDHPGIARSSSGGRLRTRPVLAGMAALALIGISVPALSFWPRPAPAPSVRIGLSISAPPGTTFPRGSADMALSPDGSRLAFVALAADGTRRLWIRRLDDVQVRPVGGTRDAHHPFWAPDGRTIGFFTHRQLVRIDEGGGSRQVLCDVRAPRGGAWGRDGTILFAADGVLKRIPDTGGTPTPVTALDESRRERAHAWPILLPDGQQFLYLALALDAANTAIYRGRFGSTRTERVVATDTQIAVVGTRAYSLVNRSMVVQDFEPDRVRLLGEPRAVAADVGRDVRIAQAAMSAAAGTVAYRPVGDQSQLTWFDRRGAVLHTFAERADYHHLWLSPDERRIAVERTDPATGRHTIWVVDVDRGTTSRLVADASGAHQPVWSPDGSRVLFGSNRFGGLDLYTMRHDGAGTESLLLRSADRVTQIPTDWSLDGRLILYDVDHHGQGDLWTLPVSATESAGPFLETSANESQGQFSPDLKWVAYTSDESGAYEVYVRRYPGGEGKWRVSTSGGAQPRWRRDGRELFYLAPDGALMAVDVKAGGPTFETGPPRSLFNTGIMGAFVDRRNHYVVTGDGQRFLVNLTDESDTRAPIIVVVNGGDASR